MPTTKSFCSIVITTVPTAKHAARIARELVSKKLAACVNVLPCASVFRWKGKVSQAREMMLLCKTITKKTNDVVRAIEKLHPYECPVIEVIPVGSMNAKGKAWMMESVGK